MTDSAIPSSTPSFCPECNREIAVELADSLKDFACPNCHKPLWFVWKQVGDVTVITFLPGLISGSESIERRGELGPVIRDASRVLVNLSHMQFISSVFLGMLVGLYRRVRTANAALRICCVRTVSIEAFHVTRLDQIFTICPDEASALKSFDSE